MKTLSNQRGVALITALLLTMIALAIVLAALYFMTQQTKLSAASKSYKSALEASHGGVEVFTRDIIPKVFNTYSTSHMEAAFSNIGLSMAGVSTACMKQKLTEDTVNWNRRYNDVTRAWETVSNFCQSPNLSGDAKESPDMKFTLRGLPLQPGFSVYAKLIDTQKGNSDTSGFDLLDNAQAVSGGINASAVSPQHIPAIYRIEVQGERETNPQEKASLTVLYAY